MAQQATNPKIEELRFKIKTDPKSRLFYQLAEELRKVKALDEAEQVLHSGLEHHPTYLSAWVSLGRTLRDGGKHQDSVNAFAKALQVDPGNVVAARLMADAYLDLGDKLEAVKKYKLVRALLPVDEDLNTLIDKLEEDINPITIHHDPPPATPVENAEQAEGSPFAQEPSPFAGDDTRPRREGETIAATAAEEAVATADVEPMRAAHEESPFEEPAAPAATAAAFDIEEPLGIHMEPMPVTAEIPAPAMWPDDEGAADVFEPSDTPAPVAEPEPAAESVSAGAPQEDITNTVTMADLYVQQGFIDRAQSIYESILDRDPNNDDVRAKLDALDARPRGGDVPSMVAEPMAAPPADEPFSSESTSEAAPAAASNARVDKLEQWLAKMKRVEGGVFRDVLQGIVDLVDGGLAASLIGLDGIAIESVKRDGVPLDAMGAEFGGFVKSIRLSNTELNTGDVLQFSLVTEKFVTFLSAVTPDYYVLLVMTPEGNYGRARFELARVKQQLRNELT
jgi:tetratricopeptide (TPR) repeat protein